MHQSEFLSTQMIFKPDVFLFLRKKDQSDIEKFFPLHSWHQADNSVFL